MGGKKVKALCPECQEVRAVTDRGLIWSHRSTLTCPGSAMDTHGWPVREETADTVILHCPPNRKPVHLTDEQKAAIIAWFEDLLPTHEDARAAFADAQQELARVNQALAEAGIDYPQGARGVRDLANQRDGWSDDLKTELEEARKELARYKREPAGAAGETMTAHELARELLARPDLPVTIQRLDEGVEFVATYPSQVALLAGDDEVVDIPIEH
ncbi:hypothetical protein [Nocardiopsis sp. FR26]|uniref:hypothetical protein n=1 Tax=Nocardiopsis sp. FR26 TaxID=2605987 RepID=UPI00135747FA|nr:hypothetical protein [Nocardiopsis sp. FR26]